MRNAVGCYRCSCSSSTPSLGGSTMHVIAVLLVLFAFSNGEAIDRATLTKAACRRNPSLLMCQKSEITTTQAPVNTPTKRPEKLIIPPPIPQQARKVAARRHDEIAELDRKFREQQIELTPIELQELHRKCDRIAPIAVKNCQPNKIARSNIGRCAAYFRDCDRFIPKGDPLEAIGNSFSSAVNVNTGSVEVNGIPYYPVNEEGGVGVDTGLSAPFGAWGGGYSDHVGVRDYFSANQEVGANWVQGKYGYKNHWSVPLVESLGVEGGQHNTVSVPLTGPDAGRVMVDNGYQVGGYYGHNDHVGVDWRRGEVQHTFGVGSPFVGAGFATGQAVAFPSIDAFAHALGK